MSKKTLLRLIVPFLLVASLFVSCEDEAATASLRINLDPGVRNTRAIVPDGIPLNVAKYRIEGTGPSGQTFTVTTTRHQTTVDGLALGAWTLKATGLNSEEMPIVKGQSSFTLTPGTRSCVIHVNELVGKGSLSVSLSWKENIVNDPRVVITLTPQNGEKIQAEPPISGTSASWRKDSLPAGSYIFQAQLYSGKFLMGGLTEAVRIVDQKTSQKALTFNLDDFPYSPGSLQIYDSTGTPITCVIQGLGPEIESGKPVTVNLVPEEIPADPISVKWFIDGNECGTGTKATFSCEPGRHRLDAVAYTTKIGSYGSATVSFEAVIKTATGVPGNGRRYGSEDGLKLGADTALTYADNSLIVVSGASDTLQVTDLLRNEISVINEYGTSAIKELGYTPAGIECSGTPIDPDGTLGLFMTVNGTTDAVRLNFSPSTKQVVRVQNSGNIQFEEAAGDDIVEHTARIKWDPALQSFVTMVHVDDKTNRKQVINLAVRKCSKKAAEEYFADFAYDVDFSVKQQHPEQSFLSMTAFGISRTGFEWLAANNDGKIVRSEIMYFGGRAVMGLFKDTSLSKAEYQNVVSIEYSKADNAYIAGANYIGVFDADRNTQLQRIALEGSSIQKLIINPEVDYAYALDRTGKRILTWKIGADGQLTDMTETKVNGTYDSMTISQDGSELAVWNAVNADAVEILRIKTR